MDVATSTANCLSLVYDLLLSVMMELSNKSTLSYQKNKIFGEIEEKIEQILVVEFENYKFLNENSPSFIRVAPSILEHAVKLYKFTNDVFPEEKNKLYSYFQVDAKKRSRQHLIETDEYVSGNGEGLLMDPTVLSTTYQKMKSLCLNTRNEILYTKIHSSNIILSFIDFLNLSSTVDFQKDLATWNVNLVKHRVDAKELFHLYIVIWIQDKRLYLLETCKLDKVKWSRVRTHHSTTSFMDEMYEQLKETLNDCKVIVYRWRNYTFTLENAVANIDTTVIEALGKQYADVVAPLKANMTPKKVGLKYVHKLTKQTTPPYIAPPELGVLLNSMKRMLDVLRPEIELQQKSCGSCRTSDQVNVAMYECLSEVTVMFRSKFRNYLEAVVENLVENTRLQNGGTKLKKILQASKGSVGYFEIQSRMQPLLYQITYTMNRLHKILETHAFIATCRGYWDRMDVLSFLAHRKENLACYKGLRIIVSILDGIFASQMQQLLGYMLQEKDIEPPRSIVEVRSILCKDGGS